MKRDALVSLSPAEVLAAAKQFFTTPEGGYGGTVVEEGEGFVRFQGFRSLLAVSAWPEDGKTRVRCSTLRYHPSVGQFLLSLTTKPSVREV